MRALVTALVLALADMTRLMMGTEPGLVHLWLCSEGEGDQIMDLAPSRSHGEIKGTPSNCVS